MLELPKALASHREMAKLFDEIAYRLRSLFEFQHGAVALHDDSYEVMRSHILEAEDPGAWQAPVEIPVDGSAVGWVWQNAQTLAIRDLESDARFSTSSTPQKHRARSILAIPLNTARRRLGVLSFWSDRPAAFDHVDIHFAELVATHIAVAIGNVTTYEEAKSAQQQITKERDQLRMLLDVSNAVVSTFDLRELLKTISAYLRRVMSHEYVSLSLYDPDTNTLQIHGMDFSEGKGLLKEGLSYRPEDAPSGLALSSRQPVLLTRRDVEQFRSELAQAILSEGFKSGCCLPLIAHGRALGILVVGSLSEDTFPQSDCDLLQPVANQVAIAVENALGFTQLVDLANKLTEEKHYLEEEIRTEYN